MSFCAFMETRVTNSLNWTIGSLRRLRSTASGNGARFEACGSED